MMNPLFIRLLTPLDTSILELDVMTNGSGGTQLVMNPAQLSSEGVHNCSRAEGTSVYDQTTEEVPLVGLATDMRDASNEEINSQALIGGFARDMLDDCPLILESVADKEPKVLLHDNPDSESELSFEIKSDFNEFVKNYLVDSNAVLVHQHDSTLLYF
jgi:hypothetical protein